MTVYLIVIAKMFAIVKLGSFYSQTHTPPHFLFQNGENKIKPAEKKTSYML